MQRFITKLAGAVGIVVLLAYLLGTQGAFLRANVSKRDSIAYWSAARLTLDRQNPYDASSVLELERQQGYGEEKPLVLRTPPWSLFVVLPLGMVDAFRAWVAWVGLLLVCLVVSIRLCFKVYGDTQRPPDVFLLAGYLFAPVPACLVSGQIGLVLSAGMALFLWLEPKHPFRAGAALILPFAKPHLLVLMWVILPIWAISRKRWAVIGGFLTALAAASGIALLFDHSIFQHYHAMIQQAAIGYEFIPALSGVVRLIFFRRQFWVQFIPLGIALIWGVRFYARHRSDWQWRTHGLALMVVSMLVTPYAWLTDEVVLLPAVLQVVLWFHARREALTWKSKLAVITFTLLNGLLLLILWAKVPFATGIYFWSGLVWFGWYFCGRKFFTAGAGSLLSPASTSDGSGRER